MIDDPHVLPSWTRWEKRRHRALIAVAVLVSAGVAAAASNERRMFLLPSLPAAFAVIAAPEPTSLRSPILGYLDDGCQPDLDFGAGSIARIVDEHDCGKGRKRPTQPAAGAPGDAPPTQPSAFFAMPDRPIDLTGVPLPVIAELAPALQTIPYFGTSPLAGPIRAVSGGGQPAIALEGVPEPASWAMMIGGLALAGAVLRRRARPASVQPA